MINKVKIKYIICIISRLLDDIEVMSKFQGPELS